MNKFEEARLKYKPEKIECLLIAESPPESRKKRFFYFEDVREHDNLYRETMRVLYPEEAIDIKYIRKNKEQFLKRFKNDGFYLIDATDVPVNNLSKTDKRAQIKKDREKLIEKINELITPETRIILITPTVFECCYEDLINQGFNVINNDKISFPLGKGLNNFRRSMRQLLK